MPTNRSLRSIRLADNGGIRKFQDLVDILEYRYGPVYYDHGCHPFIRSVAGMDIGFPYLGHEESRFCGAADVHLISTGDTYLSPKMTLAGFLAHLDSVYPMLPRLHSNCPWAPLAYTDAPAIEPLDRQMMIAYTISNPIVAARCVELGLNDDMLALVTQGWTPEEAIGDVLRMDINSERALRTIDTDEMLYWHHTYEHLTFCRKPGVWQAIKPGKWFQQHYKELTGPEIDAMVMTERGAHGQRQLHFTKDPKEIRQRYISFPKRDPKVLQGASQVSSSCMRYFADWPQHPCEVYGYERDGRCSLAYTMDAYGKTLARALCNTQDMKYSRLYSATKDDEAILKRLLTEAGYTYVPYALEGLSFKMLSHDNGILCPYVDYISSATGDGDGYMTFNGDGDISLGSTLGYTREEPQYTCCACHCALDEDDASTNDDGDYYCHECYTERYTRCAGPRCGREIRIADAVEYRGRYYCDSECAIADGAVECQQCGTLMDPDDNEAPNIPGAPEDAVWCSRHCARQDEHVQAYLDGTLYYQRYDEWDDDDAMFIPEPCWTPDLPSLCSGGLRELMASLGASL